MQVVAPRSKLRRAWALQGGISAAMTALEVETVDGRTQRIILRRQRDPTTAQKEFNLLQLIHSLGLLTPTPYHLDLSGKILAAPYLVIEYIEGEMSFTPPNLDDFIRQFAGQLVQIHQVKGAARNLSFLPHSGDLCVERGRVRSAKMDASLAEGQIREALASAEPLSSRNAASLLHGDFWPGNSLWRDGRLVAVIDWEDAACGDPLIDLAKSRSEIVWILGIAAMNAFTRRYQSLMVLDYTDLPYWDLCAALRFIRLANGDLAGMAAYFEAYGRSDITEQTIRKNFQLFITQAFAKLEN